MKGEVILVPLILLQDRPTPKLIYYSQQFLSSCLLNIILEKKRNLKLSFIYVQLQIGHIKHSNCAVSFKTKISRNVTKISGIIRTVSSHYSRKGFNSLRVMEIILEFWDFQSFSDYPNFVNKYDFDKWLSLTNTSKCFLKFLI